MRRTLGQLLQEISASEFAAQHRAAERVRAAKKAAEITAVAAAMQRTQDEAWAKVAARKKAADKARHKKSDAKAKISGQDSRVCDNDEKMVFGTCRKVEKSR